MSIAALFLCTHLFKAEQLDKCRLISTPPSEQECRREMAMFNQTIKDRGVQPGDVFTEHYTCTTQPPQWQPAGASR